MVGLTGLQNRGFDEEFKAGHSKDLYRFNLHPGKEWITVRRTLPQSILSENFAFYEEKSVT